MSERETERERIDSGNSTSDADQAKEHFTAA